MSAREYYHHVMWYTVWDAKTGELVAAGTSAMCAAKLGYKNAVSFQLPSATGSRMARNISSTSTSGSTSSAARWTV